MLPVSRDLFQSRPRSLGIATHQRLQRRPTLDAGISDHDREERRHATAAAHLLFDERGPNGLAVALPPIAGVARASA